MQKQTLNKVSIYNLVHMRPTVVNWHFSDQPSYKANTTKNNPKNKKQLKD